MLARDREVIADDSRRVRFEALDVYIDELTANPGATNSLHPPSRRQRESLPLTSGSARQPVAPPRAVQRCAETLRKRVNAGIE